MKLVLISIAIILLVIIIYSAGFNAGQLSMMKDMFEEVKKLSESVNK